MNTVLRKEDQSEETCPVEQAARAAMADESLEARELAEIEAHEAAAAADKEKAAEVPGDDASFVSLIPTPSSKLLRRFRTLGLSPQATVGDLKKLQREIEDDWDMSYSEQKRLLGACRTISRACEPLDGPAPRKAVSKSLIFKCLVLVSLVAALTVTHWADIRASMTQYEVGSVLTVRETGDKFGRVLSYTTEHQFEGTTNLVPAYQIKTTGSDKTIWLSEKFVTGALMKAGSGS